MTDKKIDTLIEDIYDTLNEVIDGNPIELNDEDLEVLGKNIAASIKRQLTPRTEKRKEKVLYFSEAGKPCSRALWYGLHDTEKEPLQPHTLIKFMYGDLLEELLAYLVKVAGHEVTDEQKQCKIALPKGWTLSGRMDYKIDGVTVDAKSASTYAFGKFRDGTLPENDPFGYMTQLANYAIHENDFNDVGFLAIEKQNGHLCLYQPDTMDLAASIPDWDELVDELEASVPPERAYKDKPYGASGNRCLEMECSYCAYKKECWRDANGGTGLRLFLYKQGNGTRPVYLTQTAQEPKVPEAEF